MHDAMPYNPIQDQGQGHGLLKFRKLHFSTSIFSAKILRQLANDYWFLNYSTMSKFVRTGFLIFVSVFVSRDLELGGVPADSPSTKKFSDFNEIWYVDRARWVMHDGMPYERIQGQGQGQGQGHQCLKATQEESTVNPAPD